MGRVGPSSLTRLYRRCREDPLWIDAQTRLVFMSDCHRGNGGWGDDFAKNRLLFLHALGHYRNRGFTYVEVGDGEELWENSSFATVHWAYSAVYIRLGYLHSEGRLIYIWGNHNNLWRHPHTVRTQLMPAMWMYFDGRVSPLLEDLGPRRVKEIAAGRASPPDRPLLRPLRTRAAVVLKDRSSGGEILVAHGHQGELWSHRVWPLSRFLVRRVWRILQNAGMRPRITPAGNYALMREAESRLTHWCRRHGVPLIAGHTHRPELPSPDDPPYMNCGSCVHPRCITAIEIEDSEVSLVKWHVSTRTAEGEDSGAHLELMRTVLEGPVPLSEYFRGAGGAGRITYRPRAAKLAETAAV
jgi:UDP-2,3-diacylglucosamine pyrophosphatase LpxH